MILSCATRVNRPDEGEWLTNSIPVFSLEFGTLHQGLLFFYFIFFLKDWHERKAPLLCQFV